MLVLLSPAKTLDFDPIETQSSDQPRFLEQTSTLIHELKKKTPAEVQKLMSVSEKLANLNVERYQQFDESSQLAIAKPALFTFKGDVYRDIDVKALDQDDLNWANDRIRILSGLYGLIRPLDLIQPYRLEMGTSLNVGEHKNLYEFWGEQITNLLKEDIQKAKAKYVLNAASKEYTKSVQLEKLGVPVIEADFRERRDGKLKFITFNAKVARGRLAELVVKHRITNLEELNGLDVNGYIFDEERSTDKLAAFTKHVS